MDLRLNIYCSILLILGTFVSTLSTAQDIIVTKSDLKFRAKVISVEKDSVKYINKMDPSGRVLTTPKSQLKYIEYFNGEVDYFQGSYSNLSEEDTIRFVTGIEDTDNSVMINAIQFYIQNLFTENHLVIDFSNSLDTNLMAVKGKIEFEFENSRHNFSMRTYKMDDKILYSKFTFGYSGSEKRYRKLSDKLLIKIRIFSGRSVVDINLSERNAEALRELFRKSNI